MKLIAVLVLILASQLFAAGAPLTIDQAHSMVEVAVKATMDSFTAKLIAYDATINADPQTKQIQSAQVKFRFADVKTGKDKRDAEMNHWQQTDQFPDCVYVMDSLKPATGDNYTATGKFTLHGVTKEISFPITVSFLPNGGCKLESEFTLDTQDYGLPIFKKLGMLKVNPLLKVKFHLEGRAQSAS
jgi:polyisoprenoid-binding protein YceI